MPLLSHSSPQYRGGVEYRAPASEVGEVFGEAGVENPGPQIMDIQPVSDVATESAEQATPVEAEADNAEFAEDHHRFRRVGFAKFFKKVGSGIKKLASKAKNVVKKVAHHVKKVAKKVVHHVKKVAKKVVHHVKKAVSKVKAFLGITGAYSCLKIVWELIRLFLSIFIAQPFTVVLLVCRLGLTSCVYYFSRRRCIYTHMLSPCTYVVLTLDSLPICSSPDDAPPPPPPPVDPEPPIPPRQKDPEFDSLNLLNKCPNKCTGHGRCLVDKGTIVNEGDVRMHPYKCHCDPDWTGDACQSRVDMYVRWFESKGTKEMPSCCNVCPSQFKNPNNFNDLPVYQNPYSVSNCDPSLSIDSRPDAGGLPPCWRPLSAEPVEGGESTEASEESSFLEIDGEFDEMLTYSRVAAYIELHDQITRSNMKRAAMSTSTSAAAHAQARMRASEDSSGYEELAAKEEKKKKKREEEIAKIAEDSAAEYKERMESSVPECCIYCDFDFWTQMNSRPRRSKLPTGGDYFRIMERQRVKERLGSQAVMKEMLRREQVREAQMGGGPDLRINREREDQSFSFIQSGVVLGDSLGAGENSDAERALRREAKEAMEANKKAGKETRTDPKSFESPRAKKCCSVCPIPAETPEEAMPSEINGEALSEKNNKFADFLRARFHRSPAECCGHCPSQFWLRTVAQDRNPFWGPEHTPPVQKVIPMEEESAEESTEGASGETTQTQSST